MDITNKVAIVTGAARGIGFAIAVQLLRNGAQYVAIFDLFKSDDAVVIDSLKQLEKEFKKESFGYYTCDVRNIKQFTECYEKVMELKKYVDILVNNAAVANDKDIDLTIDVNFTAVVKCTMVAIDHMGKHKNHKGGAVVNIGSFLGLRNEPTYPLYNATKHAVVSFVRSMKDHNKVLGVRIMCVCPGMTNTNMITPDNLCSGTFEFVDTSIVMGALNVKIQKPDNVATAVVKIIKKGKEGDVWLAQNDEPAFAVGVETDFEKMRIPF